TLHGRPRGPRGRIRGRVVDPRGGIRSHQGEPCRCRVPCERPRVRAVAPEFVAAMRRLRESLGPAKVAAVTGLASPSNVSILVYAGVDVVDSSRMMLDSARGLFHTSDGVVPMSEADRAACGCPACTTGGDLEAHNDHALHREVLLVRNHLAHGRLRELVERRLANAPWNTAVVRHL